MSTDPQQDPVIRRRFVYGDFTLDEDPGAAYSNEQVRDHLASVTFPELAHCTIAVGDTTDGVQTITFTKRATTKGSDGDWLTAWQQLPLPAVPNPLATLMTDLHGELSAVTVLHNRDAVDTYLATAEPPYNAGILPTDWRQRCWLLPATPTSSIPLGW